MGVIAKFGPLSNSDCCPGMSGVADRLITNFFLELLVVSTLLLLGPGADVVVAVAVVGKFLDCPFWLLLKFIRTLLFVSLFPDGGPLLLVCWL